MSSSSLFFRVFQHLLPDGLATRIVQATQTWYLDDGKFIDDGLSLDGIPGGRNIDRVFFGISESFQDARSFADSTHLDSIASRTTKISEYEQRFGLLPAVLPSDARANIAAAWRASGGQSPRYIQDIIWEAGFTDVYVHEWWTIPPPYDPRSYVSQPAYGTMQAGEPWAISGESMAQSNGFLSNEPMYIVNQGLTLSAPPPISDNQDDWRYFIYFASDTFPSHAQVSSPRRAEFERLICSLCPTNQWLAVLVDYV